MIKKQRKKSGEEQSQEGTNRQKKNLRNWKINIYFFFLCLYDWKVQPEGEGTTRNARTLCLYCHSHLHFQLLLPVDTVSFLVHPS